MAAYTRFGERAQITAALIVPSWMEHLPGETRLHYSKPKPSKKTKHVEELVDMLVRAVVVDEDGAMVRKVCDGKFVQLSSFRADDGWRELCDTFWKLNPEAEKDYQRWNKSDGPSAMELFPLVDEKDVA